MAFAFARSAKPQTSDSTPPKAAREAEPPTPQRNRQTASCAVYIKLDHSIVIEEHEGYRFGKATTKAEDDEEDVPTSDDNRSSVGLAQWCKKQGRNSES